MCTGCYFLLLNVSVENESFYKHLANVVMFDMMNNKLKLRVFAAYANGVFYVYVFNQ